MAEMSAEGRERPDRFAALPSAIGATIIETDPGTVIQIVEGDREVARKLKLCKCTDWDWKCEDRLGDTYCYRNCVAWSCEEVPAKPKRAIE